MEKHRWVDRWKGQEGGGGPFAINKPDHVSIGGSPRPKHVAAKRSREIKLQLLLLAANNLTDYLGIFPTLIILALP